MNANSKLEVDPARTHNTTVVLPSLSHRRSVMAPPIFSAASWPEVQRKVGQVLHPLHKSLSSLRVCHRTWEVLRVHQASTPLLDHHSTLVATSPVHQ